VEQDGELWRDRVNIVSYANSFGFVSHYNFGQGKKINTFVGLGLGLTHCQWDEDYMGTFQKYLCRDSFFFDIV
jgi:hypothetical protein